MRANDQQVTFNVFDAVNNFDEKEEFHDIKFIDIISLKGFRTQAYDNTKVYKGKTI